MWNMISPIIGLDVILNYMFSFEFGRASLYLVAGVQEKASIRISFHSKANVTEMAKNFLLAPRFNT